MLHSVSDNNLDSQDSWSNALTKYNKLRPVMPYNLFRWLVYEAIWRLTRSGISNGNTPTNEGCWTCMSVTIITVYLSDSAFKHTDKEGLLYWVINHIIYIGKVIEKTEVFIISCILHWMAVQHMINKRLDCCNKSCMLIDTTYSSLSPSKQFSSLATHRSQRFCQLWTAFWNASFGMANNSFVEFIWILSNVLKRRPFKVD